MKLISPLSLIIKVISSGYTIGGRKKENNVNP